MSGEEVNMKLICLGDSGVGKSKLVQRFLMDGYRADTSTTHAVQVHKYNTCVEQRDVCVDIWDTAGLF
jgi:Rab-like protein 2